MKWTHWIAATALFLFGLPAHASPAGIYQLDNQSMIAQLKKKIQKLPKKRQVMAGMALKMLKGMRMTLTLKKNGVAKMRMKINFMGKVRKKSGLGKWRHKGKTIFIRTSSKTNRGVKTDKIECKLNKRSLACVNTRRRSSQLFFIKK